MSALKSLIIKEIKASGPMPVDCYMELCLTHPKHGYYIKKDPFGARGDFTTAPEISQIFGEIIAVWLIGKWQELGSPKEVALIELGPGRGTLMADILRTIKITPKFKPQIHLVEISPVLAALQKNKLADCNVTWHAKVPHLNIPTILIANEFFDALPIKQFIADEERKIVEKDGELAFNMIAEDDLTLEICEVGVKIMKEITHCYEAGIIIDYGYLQNHKRDTLQAVAQHKYTNILQSPGDADLTSHVVFNALEKASRKKVSITTQREFLLNHGAATRAEMLGKQVDLYRLVDTAQMGELFKVLCF